MCGRRQCSVIILTQSSEIVTSRDPDGSQTVNGIEQQTVSCEFEQELVVLLDAVLIWCSMCGSRQCSVMFLTQSSEIVTNRDPDGSDADSGRC